MQRATISAIHPSAKTSLRNPSRLSAYESRKRLEEASKFCYYTTATASPTTLLFKSTAWPSFQIHVCATRGSSTVALQARSVASHKLKCTCCLRSNLSVHSSFQPAVRKIVNCETGITFACTEHTCFAPCPATCDESHSDYSAVLKFRRSVSKLTGINNHTVTEQHDTTHLRKEHSSSPSEQNWLQSTEFPDPTGPRSLQFQQPKHANMHQHQPPRQGVSYTEHQTREFINCVRAFNLNFSFQYLLQTTSVMFLQFMQHPCESALPVSQS
jgi:hypothetical protein